MNKMFLKLISIPWYAIVVGAYAVLSLYASNIQQTYTEVIYKPLLIVLTGSVFLLIIFRFVFGDWHSSAITTAVFNLLFFTYGHLYEYIEDAVVWGLAIGRHRVLIIAWVAIAIIVLWMAKRYKENIRSQASAINMISLVLLAFPLYTMTTYAVSESNLTAASSRSDQQITLVEDQILPDVYYMILDSYTRSDVLKTEYGYDNSEFINELENIGFYVADCSTSNYIWTRLSISSALNMQYLQENPVYIAASDKDLITEDLIRHSEVRQVFESLGYKTVAFATGFPFNEITDADMYLAPPSWMEDVHEFDALLIQTTLLRVFQDFGVLHINKAVSTRYRDRTLFAFDQIDELARLGGPKFVYFHIIPPHPPFVFGPNGEFIDPDEFAFIEGHFEPEIYAKGYIGQVEFVNDQILKAVKRLITESPTPPLIIVQGDHGPWRQQGENRISILNAYYLPGHTEELYPSISPINSFRIIFNEYFNANYPLLENKSYISPYENEYDFTSQPIGMCKNDN